jgi:glutamate dehydrogenase
LNDYLDGLGSLVIDNGLKFRNEFHLDRLAGADLFVPCGGRPEAVDLSNVQMLLNSDGTSRFKYVSPRVIDISSYFFTFTLKINVCSSPGIPIFFQTFRLFRYNFIYPFFI